MNHYMMDNHDSLYYVLHYIDTALADFSSSVPTLTTVKFRSVVLNVPVGVYGYLSLEV